MDTVKVNQDFYEKHWMATWKYNFMYDPNSKVRMALYCMDQLGGRPRNKKILDIGFGFGKILFSLDPSNLICGVELAEGAVQKAIQRARRKGYPRFDFKVYEGTGALPYNDAQFDMVICSHVLEHVPDDRTLLAEIKRLLAPEGTAILNIPIHEEHFPDPRHMRKYTVEGFRNLIRDYGFEIRYDYAGDKFWDLFGWFFEKNWHKRIPVLGFLISSALNIGFSSIPFPVQRAIERMLPRRINPRQFIVAVQHKR